MKLREERYLFELPYDARLGPNLVNHHKDVVDAPREVEWETFDLQLWLGLDTPPVEGTMCSTTLKFSAAERPTDTMYFVQHALPNFFRFNRRYQYGRIQR